MLNLQPEDQMPVFLTMANYNTWTNAHIFALCAKLSEQEYRKDLGAFFGSVHNTLNHILLVDILWLGRLKGENIGHIHALDQILHDDLESLSEARVKGDQALIDYIRNLQGGDLERTFSYTRMNGISDTGTVQDILLTLFNHQTHHRGQVHAMLTQSGIAKSDMPDLDLVDYLATVQS